MIPDREFFVTADASSNLSGSDRSSFCAGDNDVDDIVDNIDRLIDWNIDRLIDWEMLR